MDARSDIRASGEAGADDLARAARRLSLRSRREAGGLFAGNYASAIRGSGIEFEESRPYLPGDDVRSIDQVATARTGRPFVKRFREERNHTLIFALDTSASMACDLGGRSKTRTAAHALALLATAAGTAGDATALVAFDDAVHTRVRFGRGRAHTWALIRAASDAAAGARGDTQIAAGIHGLLAHTRRPATVVLISDFRDPALLPEAAPIGRLERILAPLTKRCDVIAGVVVDPFEQTLPDVGPVRIGDPERPGASVLLATGSRRQRERFREAALAWRSHLVRDLRRAGAEPLWLRTDRSPLHALGRFFEARATRRLGNSQR